MVLLHSVIDSLDDREHHIRNVGSVQLDDGIGNTFVLVVDVPRDSFRSFGNERWDDRNVLQELWRIVSLLEILGAIVRKPNFAFGIFPNQNFEGQVDRDAGSCQHEWGARLGAAKNQ